MKKICCLGSRCSQGMWTLGGNLTESTMLVLKDEPKPVPFEVVVEPASPASNAATKEGNWANGSLGVGAVNMLLGTANVSPTASSRSCSSEMEENDGSFAPGDHTDPSLVPNVSVGSLSRVGGTRIRGIIIPRPGLGDINPRSASSESDTCEPVTDSGNPPSEEAPPDPGKPPNSMRPLFWLESSSSTSMETDCQKALLSLLISPFDASLSALRSSSLWLTALGLVAARTGGAPVVSCTGVKKLAAVKSR